MADGGSRRGWILVAVLAVAGSGAGLLVASRSGDDLPRSATCDDVEPGGSRLRSRAPDPGSAPPGATEGGQAQAAFRPDTAEAVYCEDLADPFVLAVDRAVGRRLLVFGTNTPSANVPVLLSGSILRSEEVADALPALPAWSEPGGVWAPSVLALDDAFVLHYTTTDAASGRQCISSATSPDPEGPFVDDSVAPLVCPIELGGAIDPSTFVDVDGQTYLLWKSDGNCCGLPATIHAQPLAPDGRSLTGPAVAILGADQPWEGGLVEAPAMVEHEGVHHLFYSANDWSSGAYAIGHATCETPLGPCAKPLPTPWLGSSDVAAGPGGQEVFRTPDGGFRMVFHAWEAGAVGYDAGGFRRLYTVGLRFVDGKAVTAE